jgi:hypothetical protein
MYVSLNLYIYLYHQCGERETEREREREKEREGDFKELTHAWTLTESEIHRISQLGRGNSAVLNQAEHL